jgi:hypothetical protein
MSSVARKDTGDRRFSFEYDDSHRVLSSTTELEEPAHSSIREPFARGKKAGVSASILAK